jgi:transcriptional regulator with XRE-family HTH domain
MRQNQREIGLRIAEARRESGLTQAEFARLVGVTPRSVQAYEAGRTVPWRHLDRLEEITQRPRAWFLRGPATESPPSELEERLVALVGQVASEAERLAEATTRLTELLERRDAMTPAWMQTEVTLADGARVDEPTLPA